MVRVGVALPHYDFSLPDGRPVSIDDVVSWARTFEGLGFDSLWISDHLYLDLARYGGPSKRFGSPEAMTTLAALARETERVRLGTLVLCAAFRNPVMLANEAATINLASGGRLELGLGAGWYESEFAALGIPFGSAGERIAALEEYLQIVRALFLGTAVTFKGSRYTVDDALIRPLPAGEVPLWVGAKGGPRMLRLIAGHADGWNVVWRVSPDAYEQKLAVLRTACDAAGRDPATVRRSVGLFTIVGEDESDLEARWRAVQAWTPGDAINAAKPADWAHECLVGTAEQCIERIRAFDAMGVGEIVVSFASLPFAIADAEMPHLFAERVLPHVR